MKKKTYLGRLETIGQFAVCLNFLGELDLYLAQRIAIVAAVAGVCFASTRRELDQVLGARKRTLGHEKQNESHPATTIMRLQ